MAGSQYRVVLDVLPDATFIVDKAGVVRHANRRAEVLFESRLNELLGRPFEQLFVVRDRDLLTGFLGPSGGEAGAGRGNFSVALPDGRAFQAEITVSPADIDGEEAMIAAIRDYSEHDSVEHTLLEQKEFLSRLIDTEQTIVLLLDRAGRIVMFNRYAETVTGYRSDDVIGKGWFETFLLPEDQDRIRAFFEQIFEEGSHKAHTNPIVAKDGTVREVEWYGRVVEDEQGRAIGLISTGQDVTVRQEADRSLRAALREADQENLAKSEFMAAASHDLRQPLQSLLLYMGALERKSVAPDILDIVARMRLSIEGMRELLDALLDITRYDAGNVELSVKSFAVGDIFPQVEAEIRPLAEQKGLRFRIVPSSLYVRSDQGLLDRVIQNLLFNAVRYTEYGGILLGCRRRNGTVRIEVWDTGPGIPEDDRDRIFREFVQLGNPARDRTKGLGLGLAIVSRIARLLGHRVGVRSCVGRGSVFSIEVPLGETSTPSALVKANGYAAKPSASKVALVVDDDQDVRASIRTLLALEGFTVFTAADWDDAVRVTARWVDGPDVIISDYRLPGGINGFEVIRRLRAIFDDQIPAVLLTGNPPRQVERQAKAMNCRVLHKPVEAEDLAKLVEI